jgi:hypothetical protein
MALDASWGRDVRLDAAVSGDTVATASAQTVKRQWYAPEPTGAALAEAREIIAARTQALGPAPERVDIGRDV